MVLLEQSVLFKLQLKGGICFLKYHFYSTLEQSYFMASLCHSNFSNSKMLNKFVFFRESQPRRRKDIREILVKWVVFMKNHNIFFATFTVLKTRKSDWASRAVVFIIFFYLTDNSYIAPTLTTSTGLSGDLLLWPSLYFRKNKKKQKKNIWSGDQIWNPCLAATIQIDLIERAQTLGLMSLEISLFIHYRELLLCTNLFDLYFPCVCADV